MNMGYIFQGIVYRVAIFRFCEDRSRSPSIHSLTPFRTQILIHVYHAVVTDLGHSMIGELDNNLIMNFTGQPAIGERIIMHGRVIDETGRGIPNVLVEIWQANAGGRYRHKKDSYLAPLDPNFGGCGRTISGRDGAYEFLTVRPGAYPWPNRVNDWRPMHIHISVFGSGFGQRLITQMYFEGDPLIARCPIVNTIGSERAIQALVAPLDMNRAIPMDCLAYKFDIVLRGRRQSFFENRPEGM